MQNSIRDRCSLSLPLAAAWLIAHVYHGDFSLARWGPTTRFGYFSKSSVRAVFLVPYDTPDPTGIEWFQGPLL